MCLEWILKNNFIYNVVLLVKVQLQMHQPLSNIYIYVYIYHSFSTVEKDVSIMGCRLKINELADQIKPCRKRYIMELYWTRTKIVYLISLNKKHFMDLYGN